MCQSIISEPCYIVWKCLFTANFCFSVTPCLSSSYTVMLPDAWLYIFIQHIIIIMFDFMGKGCFRKVVFSFMFLYLCCNSEEQGWSFIKLTKWNSMSWFITNKSVPESCLFLIYSVIRQFPGSRQSIRQFVCVYVCLVVSKCAWIWKKNTQPTGFCLLCAPGVTIDLWQQTWKTWGVRQLGREVEGERHETKKKKNEVNFQP